MAISNDTVSAIKGNSIDGSLWIYSGEFTGSVTADSDFETLGFEEMGYASSEDGISYSQSADASAITAWGDKKLADIYSNSAATVTVNLFSFLNPETLRTVFGRDNVTIAAGSVTVSLKGAAGAASQNSIAIAGLDRSGRNAVIFARLAAVDPNLEFTWNDADPVAVPAVFNLYKDSDNNFGKIFIETPVETPGD